MQLNFILFSFCIILIISITNGENDKKEIIETSEEKQYKDWFLKFRDHFKFINAATNKEKKEFIKKTKKQIIKLDKDLLDSYSNTFKISKESKETIIDPLTGSNIILSSLKSFTDEQVYFYNKYGFIIIKDFFNSEDIIKYIPAIWHAITLDTDIDAIIEPFLSTTNLWQSSKLVSQFLLNEKLAKAAAELMNVDGVRLFQDKSFIKSPASHESPAHQDRFASLIEENDKKMINAWMPLTTNLTSNNGALLYLPMSHQKNKIIGRGHSFYPCPHILSKYDKESKKNTDLMATDAFNAGMGNIRRWQRETGFSGSCDASFVNPSGGYEFGLGPGDVAFHDGYLVHGSNSIDDDGYMRAAVSVQYFEDGATRSLSLATPKMRDSDDGASQMLWGDLIEKGDVIDTPYTPLLWHKYKNYKAGSDAYDQLQYYINEEE